MAGSVSRGTAISASNPARVILSNRLRHRERRWYYCHEVGHALCGHAASFTLLSLDEARLDRQERQAWEIAAELLIPLDVVFDAAFEGKGSDEIAAVCEVLAALVELYRRQYVS